MFAFRLLKRIHKPFIFLGLCCVSIVVIGFTSVKASSENVHSNTLDFVTQQGINSKDEFMQNTIGDDPSSSQNMGPKIALNTREKLADAQLLASVNVGKTNSVNNELHTIDPVPQLPFCNSNVRDRDGGRGNTKKKAEDEDLNQNHGKSTDKFVVPILGTSRDLIQPGWDITGRHVVVSTLDGQVILLNQNGEILWSICTGQLFSSTISSLQLTDDGKLINLIPSLTGGLYKYNGDSLQPMPLNADSLLKKSFKMSNDVVITGGKELRTFGVEVNSGSIRYECGMGDCYYPSKTTKDPDEEKRPVLIIKKQSQIVRAIDSTTGFEKWNFSVGTHELSLAGFEELGCHDDDKESHVNINLKVIIPDGLILGANTENKVMWQQRFGSPISQAWVIENGKLVAIDTLKNSPLLDDYPALYVGMHKKQFYVQESHATQVKVEQAFGLEASISTKSNNQKSERLKLEWKTSNAIEANNVNTALTSYSPPIWATVDFKPFFVFERDEINTTPMPAIEEVVRPFIDDESDSDEEDNSTGLHYDEDDGPIQIIFVSLWYWWKEVLGISLLTAVLLNILLMRPMIRAVRSQTVREMMNMFRYLTNKQKEDEKALIPIHDKDQFEHAQGTLTSLRQRSVSSSSNTSQIFIPEELPFSSQYLKEFDPIQCLGRGGFGVVFEAKKKIDDRHYAVKRIPLPNREKSRVRVMREVKALAQLDHKNIVRYFNAWTEDPPSGWLEKNDPLWNAMSIGSCSPTMDYPSEMRSLDFETFDNENRRKPDHSKISVPTTPGEYPDNDDSYIVFGTDSQTSNYSPFEIPSSAESKRVSVTNSIIPISEENSVSSRKGFFARPTSLNIPSLDSFGNESSNNGLTRLSSSRSNSMSNCDADIDSKDMEEKCDSQNCTVMYLYIQQELCQKRTLQEWLRAEKDRSVLSVMKIFAQIVEAVEYVHSKKLIHRDLKPSNIFLAGDDDLNGENSSVTVKIGDFGLATTVLTEIDAEGMTPSENNGESVRVNLTGQVGTHLYMSPEQYHKKPYDYKVDIYSLGLIFFELLVPFSTDMERYDIISKVRRLSFPDKFCISHPFELEHIQEMVSHDPSKRPDATKIKAWVKSHLQSLPTPRNEDSRSFTSYSEPASLASTVSPKVIGYRNSPNESKHRAKYYKTQSVT